MARVCMLLHNPLISDARVEREARALARAGHQVTIVATWEPGLTAREERRDGVTIRRVSRRPLGVDLITRLFALLLHQDDRSADAPAPDPPQGPTVRGVLRMPVVATRRVLRRLPTKRFAIEWRMALAAMRTRPDVVHAHDLNTLAAGVRAARWSRARLVYDSHEISAGLPSVKHPEHVIAHERGLIGRADAVIHTTPMRAAWAAETYGIPTPTLVRNVPEGARDVRPLDLAEAGGFAPGTRVILHQGNMSPDRGLEALVDAMGSLDGFGLLLLGGGALRGELERRVGRAGLGDRVRFRSSVPHEELLGWTAGAWCGASLLVDTCLNHRYSLPNKLFEYLAVGVPLIASNNPEIARFVTEHGCGELCDPADPASIAAAVKRLADRYESARRATRSAGEGFRWENEERTLLGVYDRLLGPKLLTSSGAAGAPRAGS